MRRGRLVGVVSGLVIALVATATADGFLATRILLNWQRLNYAAGHADYVRGDCRQALPHLNASLVGRRPVATQAAQERFGCLDLQAVRRTADSQVKAGRPGRAVEAYLNYLLEQPPDPPLATAAQRDARVILGSTDLSEIVTNKLCDAQEQLGDASILRMNWKDVLASPYLAACGALREQQNDAPGAYRVYRQIQEDFPATEEATSTLTALGRTAVRTAGVLSRVDAEVPWSVPAPGLHGKSEVVVVTTADVLVEMMLVGHDQVRVDHKPGCSKCKVFDTAAAGGCPRPGENQGHSFKFKVRPGRYSAIINWDGVLDEQSIFGSWKLKPDRIYLYCLWSWGEPGAARPDPAPDPGPAPEPPPTTTVLAPAGWKP